MLRCVLGLTAVLAALIAHPARAADGVRGRWLLRPHGAYGFAGEAKPGWGVGLSAGRGIASPLQIYVEVSRFSADHRYWVDRHDATQWMLSLRVGSPLLRPVAPWMEIGGGFVHLTRRGVYTSFLGRPPRYSEFHGDPGGMTLASGATISLASRAALDVGVRWSQILGQGVVTDGPSLGSFGHFDVELGFLVAL